MKITLNVKEHPLDTQLSIIDLLKSLDLANKPVVVELNQKAIFPRAYPSIILSDNDRVEIIVISAGG